VVGGTDAGWRLSARSCARALDVTRDPVPASGDVPAGAGGHITRSITRRCDPCSSHPLLPCRCATRNAAGTPEQEVPDE